MIFILGAGGFAREVAFVAKQNYVVSIGYLSDDPYQWQKQYEFGKCLGKIEHITDIKYCEFIPGVGSPIVRKALVERALAMGWEPQILVAPNANCFLQMDTGSTIGDGSIICSGVSATVNVHIGKYVNVNLNCTLGHDCVLEDYVNLSPSVNISGYAHLEEGVDVGTGAVIGPKVRIGKGSIVGAGATVLKDIPPGEIWVGTPAKFLRKVE